MPKELCNSCYPSHQNNAQLPSDKTCYVAWTSSSQSEAELACIWCLSSDIQTGAAQKSLSWDFISSASSVKLGFNSTCLATMLGSRKTYRACCPVMCQKNRATHATQAIKNNAQLPSDKTCYVAWTSSSQSEAELACIWCLSSDTFRLERHRNHHLETSYQVHLLSSLVSMPHSTSCQMEVVRYFDGLGSMSCTILLAHDGAARPVGFSLNPTWLQGR